MGREAHREGGWKNDNDRERKKITLYIYIYIYILAHKMTVMLSTRYMTVGGQIYSRISFRSDDDNDGIPSSSISTQLRGYDFSSSISIIYCSYCSLLFSYQYSSDYNSYRFLCQYINVYVYVCVCISRDRENVPCFIAIVGRSVDLVRMFMCVCACMSSL
jgi:hypothetical protein